MKLEIFMFECVDISTAKRKLKRMSRFGVKRNDVKGANRDVNEIGALDNQRFFFWWCRELGECIRLKKKLVPRFHDVNDEWEMQIKQAKLFLSLKKIKNVFGKFSQFHITSNLWYIFQLRRFGFLHSSHLLWWQSSNLAHILEHCGSFSDRSLSSPDLFLASSSALKNWRNLRRSLTKSMLI